MHLLQPDLAKDFPTLSNFWRKFVAAFKLRFLETNQTQRLPVFNWNLEIQGVPPTWRQTEGAGVKIAVIDSGADLTHPALQHLAALTHNRFNAARPDFDPMAADLNGEEDVMDAAVNGEAHGTYCASVIAARAVDTAPHGVGGVAPAAEILVYKATDADGESTNAYFLKALKSAIRQNVDLISVSYVPTGVRAAQRDEIDALFRQMAEQGIVMFVALDNTNLLTELNNMRYPATRPEVIPVGVVSPKFMTNLPASPVFNPAIRWLLPKIPVRYCDLNAAPEGPYIDDLTSASTANACLTGIAALLISQWKKTEGEAYQRRGKAELMAALSSVAGRFIPAQLLQNPAFQFVQP